MRFATRLASPAAVLRAAPLAGRLAGAASEDERKVLPGGEAALFGDGADGQCGRRQQVANALQPHFLDVFANRIAGREEEPGRVADVRLHDGGDVAYPEERVVEVRRDEVHPRREARVGSRMPSPRAAAPRNS